MNGSTATTQDASKSAKPDLEIVDIVPDGDILLDVTFDISKKVLKEAKKASTTKHIGNEPQAPFKAKTRVGYRVHLSVLKQNSRYFTNLLSDTRFAEAKAIEAAFEKLSLQGVKPEDADVKDLPVVKINEDDEASQSTNQVAAFGDLMRVLHRVPTTIKPLTMSHLVVIAILADRFDCAPLVSKWLNVSKFKWPATPPRVPKDDGGPALSRQSEETLRQKILVAYLLNQPVKMQSSTRELILFGSRRWAVTWDENEGEDAYTAAWWDLPDNLEAELHTRRTSILSTLASIPQHFFRLYAHVPTASSSTPSPAGGNNNHKRPPLQCKLGYDTSSACDSYQLGEIVKFLTSRNLFTILDFSPRSLDTILHDPRKDFSATDITSLISILKQCPSYQIDKNHTHCGLRTRLLPILEYVEARLQAQAIAISLQGWKKDPEVESWSSEQKSKHKKKFSFTRGLSSDQRLRYGGAMAGDKFARELFTAEEWDWTGDDHHDVEGRSFGNWKIPA
ncbi:hypothetical protein QBC35DRAFT_183193 [Podospora australis]|uniref:Hydroxyproline-rich glyco protein n=1 Tax=Podospora australis TaxID=1536484 RepID=A0AAN7AJZ6_9PEZI|nr:hypothetical protein QBC35DRAFT_183193 [Podospora australis]